jgi:hypothetical protein
MMFVAFAGVLAAGPSVATQSLQSATMPRAARTVLTKKWPLWELASIDSAASSCATGKPAEARVTADFDYDDHVDIAAAIKTAKGVRLVALVWRSWGYDLYDVDALGEQTATGYLEVAGHGTKFINPTTMLPDFFSGNTLTIHTCGKPTTAYTWNGVGFRKITIAGS